MSACACTFTATELKGLHLHRHGVPPLLARGFAEDLAISMDTKATQRPRNFRKRAEELGKLGFALRGATGSRQGMKPVWVP